MDREQNRTDSERILNLKDIVLEHFRQLPAEHQASLGLVLVSSIMEREWGTWFREVLSTRFGIEHSEERASETILIVQSVTHDDLENIGFTPQEIGQLTEDDLATIAKMITDHWTQDVFRDDLTVIAEMVLERKHKP